MMSHQMETFSALLAFCARNSPVTGKFPTQRPVTLRSFGVFFAHYDVIVMECVVFMLWLAALTVYYRALPTTGNYRRLLIFVKRWELRCSRKYTSLFVKVSCKMFFHNSNFHTLINMHWNIFTLKHTIYILIRTNWISYFSSSFLIWNNAITWVKVERLVRN